MRPPVSEAVLDASAVLAVMGRETGWERVAALLPRSCISTVNLSEVAAKIAERGGPVEATRLQLSGYQMAVIPFDQDLAYLAASLRPLSKALGLSFGDRACLALGLAKRLPVVTAEREWARLNLDISLDLIR